MSDNNAIFQFDREKYKWLIIGCVIVVFGFILMSGGGSEDPNQFNYDEIFSFRRITLAPIVVLIGYGVVMFSIFKKKAD